MLITFSSSRVNVDYTSTSTVSINSLIWTDHVTNMSKDLHATDACKTVLRIRTWKQSKWMFVSEIKYVCLLSITLIDK